MKIAKNVLPQRWQWLVDEPGPLMIKGALKHYGLKEIVGPKHNPTILAWAYELARWIGNLYRDKGDEVPWCGLFIGVLAKQAGKVTPNNPLSALAWADWGRQVAFLGRSGKVIGQPKLGDVMVFTRKGGGHVGLYVGEDASAYHILGGNQGNAVSITRIVKSRFHSAHRLYNNQPANVRAIHVDENGPISENEQ